MSKLLPLFPRLSEKAYELSNAHNTYVVDVPKGATKHTIMEAIKSQYNVKPKAINIVNVDGKRKRTISKKGRVVKLGKNTDTKKAYVTLKSGDKLPFFEAMEAAAAEEQERQDKVTKALEKQSEKESKSSRKVLGRRKKDKEEK